MNVYPMRSVRLGRWKYIVNLHPEWTYTTHIDRWVGRVDSGVYFPSWRQAAGTDPQAKAIVDHYYTRPAEELYDLQVDPTELRNVASDPRNAAVLNDLRGRLARWRTEQGDTGRVYAEPLLRRPRLEGDQSQAP